MSNKNFKINIDTKRVGIRKEREAKKKETK
jgi:hypothetical protein